MTTYRWLTDLDRALAAAGVPYEEVGYSSADPTGAGDWRTRGRPYSTGDFDPQGVLCHHTASPAGTSDKADLNVLLAGNSGAPGPISQLYIGRTGTVYLVAAGRANHGGKGRRPDLDLAGCADMNKLCLGIEAGNNGVGERWPDAQTTIYARVVAALCAWYDWDYSETWLHATTGPPGGGCNSKIDPAGPWQREPHLTSQTWDLAAWQSFVAEHGAPGPTPTPPPLGGDEMPRIGPLLIQATGRDGTQPGVVYLPSGDGIWLRRIVDEAMLVDVRDQLIAAGYPRDQVNAPPQPVDRVASFGAVVVF